MNVRQLATHLKYLVEQGQGESLVFISPDEQTNEFFEIDNVDAVYWSSFDIDSGIVWGHGLPEKDVVILWS
jgi:hypothetical protein